MRRQKTFKAVAALMLAIGPCAVGQAAIDPKADALLRSMSDLLASTKEFTFTSEEHHERLRRSGERATLEFTRSATVRRPDGLRFDYKGGEREGALYYDGKKLTFVGHEKKLWAQTGVPPTIDEAMDYVGVRLAVPVPMADILYSSPYEALVGEGTTGIYAGRDEIAGKSCHHLEFQHEVVDYNLWVQDGDRALPCRLEMRYKLDAGVPVSRITFKEFDLSPSIDESSFKFTAPPDYRRIRVVGRRTPKTEEQGAQHDQQDAQDGKP